jgi:endonuclease/exonuclease/phosphatase family metal-dependent hydrolase
VLATGDFWLSDTPHVVGSRSWDSKHFRICTWARLGDRRAERELLHANTHFDDQGVQARTEAGKLLRHKLPELAQIAAIALTGDFNSTQDDEPYRALTEPGSDKLILLDSYREIHLRRTTEEGSLHGFNGMTNGPRIDWILHTPHLITAAADIDRHHSPGGQYPSDHFPITAIFHHA